MEPDDNSTCVGETTCTDCSSNSFIKTGQKIKDVPDELLNIQGDTSWRPDSVYHIKEEHISSDADVLESILPVDVHVPNIKEELVPEETEELVLPFDFDASCVSPRPDVEHSNYPSSDLRLMIQKRFKEKLCLLSKTLAHPMQQHVSRNKEAKSDSEVVAKKDKKKKRKRLSQNSIDNARNLLGISQRNTGRVRVENRGMLLNHEDNLEPVLSVDVIVPEEKLVPDTEDILDPILSVDVDNIAEIKPEPVSEVLLEHSVFEVDTSHSPQTPDPTCNEREPVTIAPEIDKGSEEVFCVQSLLDLGVDNPSNGNKHSDYLTSDLRIIIQKRFEENLLRMPIFQMKQIVRKNKDVNDVIKKMKRNVRYQERRAKETYEQCQERLRKVRERAKKGAEIYAERRQERLIKRPNQNSPMRDEVLKGEIQHQEVSNIRKSQDLSCTKKDEDLKDISRKIKRTTTREKIQIAERRARETADQRKERLKKGRERMAKMRAAKRKIASVCQEQLQKDREWVVTNKIRAAERRARETTEQRKERLKKARERIAKMRAARRKIASVYQEQLQKDRERVAQKRAKMNEEQCLESRRKDREKHRLKRLEEQVFSLTDVDSESTVPRGFRIKDGKYMCSICYDSFEENCNLKQHYLMHFQVHNFVCAECGQSFAYEYDLLTHIMLRSNEMRPFRCEVCNMQFRALSDIMKHYVRKHMNKRKDLNCDCKVCNQTFPGEEILTACWKSHQSNTQHNNQYLCDVCGENMGNIINFQTHYRIHTGEKPFICTECGIAFISFAGLYLHSKVHSKIKSYVCDICGKAFKYKSSIAYHMRLKHMGKLNQ